MSGYASREQVNCDQTKRPCPFLPKKDDLSPPEKLIDTSKYQLKPPPNFQSQFEREMELEDEMALNEQLQREKEEKEFEIREFEKPLPDEYQGHRIHSWVIILPDPGGPRGHEIIEPFFIESSSGVAYLPKDEETNILYLGVESIWNDTNYWVNMQINSSGCREINWNLSKVELWEHLLPGEPWTMRGIDDIDQEEDEEISIAQEKHLDMPGSYVNQIEIHSLGNNLICLLTPSGTYMMYLKFIDIIITYKEMYRENFRPIQGVNSVNFLLFTIPLPTIQFLVSIILFSTFYFPYSILLHIP